MTDEEVLAKHSKCSASLCGVEGPMIEWSKLAEECRRADALKARKTAMPVRKRAVRS